MGIYIKSISFDRVEKNFPFRYKNKWWKRDNRIINVAEEVFNEGEGKIAIVIESDTIVGQRITPLLNSNV